MENLLNDVAEIGNAAERAGQAIHELGDIDERVGSIMTFICNLSRDVEDYLENYQTTKPQT